MRIRFFMLILAGVLLFPWGYSFCQEAEPPSEKNLLQNALKKKAQAPGEQSASQQTPGDLDNPKATLEEVSRKMQQIRERMEDQKLGSDQTGPQTQQLQREVISELDRLIELAQRPQQQPPQPQEQDPQPEEQPNPEENPRQQPQPMPGQETEPMPGAEPQEQATDPNEGPRNNNDDVEESTEQVEQGENKIEQMLEAQREDRIIQVWGHLPERVRARILNLSREKSLPQYENLNERYYRALAEQEKEIP